MADQATTQQPTGAAGTELLAPAKDLARQLQVVDGRVQVSTLQDAYFLCKVLHGANMVPKDKQGPGGAEKCLAAYLYGMNLGLDIMTSIQSVAVIGAMPSVWGDAMLALVKNSKTLERWLEMEFPLEECEGMASLCMAKRKDIGEGLDIKELIKGGAKWPAIHELALVSGWYSNIYSDEDIAAAGLGGKDTYKHHGRRMRKMRARAFTLRDGWPDVLKGIHAREEFDPDQVPDTEPGGNGGGNGKRDKAEDLAAMLKQSPVDIRPVKLEVVQAPALPGPKAETKAEGPETNVQKCETLGELATATGPATLTGPLPDPHEVPGAEPPPGQGKTSEPPPKATAKPRAAVKPKATTKPKGAGNGGKQNTDASKYNADQLAILKNYEFGRREFPELHTRALKDLGIVVNTEVTPELADKINQKINRYVDEGAQ